MSFLINYTISEENLLTTPAGKTLLAWIIPEMGQDKGIAIDFLENSSIAIYPIRIDRGQTKIEITGKIIKDPTFEKIEQEIAELIKHPYKNFN